MNEPSGGGTGWPGRAEFSVESSLNSSTGEKSFGGSVRCGGAPLRDANNLELVHIEKAVCLAEKGETGKE